MSSPDLPLFAVDPRGLDGFVRGAANEAAVRALAGDGALPPGLAILYGPAGAGKSRLLRDWAARHDAPVWIASELTSALIAAFAAQGERVAAVDDAQSARPEPLFDLINFMALVSGRLVLAAGEDLAPLFETHRDLASRLSGASVLRIAEPEEAMFSPLLTALAAQAGLTLAPNAADYAAKRLGRTYAAAHRWIEALTKFGNNRIGLALARRSLADGPAHGGE